MATPTGDAAALAWLPRLLQTTDSMFPTGAYAHSFGLEGAVQDGLVSDTASLDDFLTNQIVRAMTTWKRFANSTVNTPR
jgi:urease accessory protein